MLKPSHTKQLRTILFVVDKRIQVKEQTLFKLNEQKKALEKEITQFRKKIKRTKYKKEVYESNAYQELLLRKFDSDDIRKIKGTLDEFSAKVEKLGKKKLALKKQMEKLDVEIEKVQKEMRKQYAKKEKYLYLLRVD